MSSNNILYICNAMLHNVVIITDTNGKNELDSLPKFKYQQRLINRCKHDLKNHSVLINEIIHSNCIIFVNEHGTNNVLKSKDEMSNRNTEENNLFIQVLKQVHHDKEPTNIKEFLLRKRESLQSKLKNATYYFNMKSLHKACDLYKEVLTLIETDMYPDEFMLNDTDILGIKFGYALSKMAICKTEELQFAADLLTILKTEHGDDFPTLYYYLARCLFLLEKYQDAKDVLDIGQNKLKNIEFLKELNWPGSNTKMIVHTEKPLLEENIRTLFKECNEFRLPDIKCIFGQCQNKNIFFNSPCFNGYVIVKCSNKCNFTYHRNCWKMKLKNDCIKKPSYFLGNSCPTDDCGGIINEILIYDENLHLNTFIIPKTVTSDKHEENHSSIDKSTKKIQSGNDKTRIISDITTNKSNILKKNVEKNVIKESITIKKEKKANFNLNAKEYVPKKQEPLKLNTTAKEYISPKINFNYTDESEKRPNLFDVIPSPTISTPEANEFVQHENDASYMFSISRNGSVVNYSEEDKVSLDFSPDDNSINKKLLTKKNIEENSKYSQTHFNNHSNSFDIITNLKSEVSLLQSQLFQSEEAYNNLLAQNKLLQRKLQEAKAKPKTCDNCTILENVLTTRNDEHSVAVEQLKQLEKNNGDLTNKLKELEKSMHLELQEKQAKIVSNESLVQKNGILQGRIDELMSRMKTMTQQHTYMTQHSTVNLRKVMFDQINCIRHAYASYFTLYENKSKHMLWELEDIKSLSTPETLPTLADVEENMAAWKSALDNSVKSRFMMNGFYEHLFRQFSNEQNTACPMPISFPSFIIEPPNIIIRHFKSLIIVNKRLEQELHQQMNSFYKMMSTPYPGVFPQTQKQSEISNDMESVAEKNHSILQNNTSENVAEIVSNTSISSSKNELQKNSKWDSTNVTGSKVPNMYDNLVMKTPIGPTSRKITKQSLLNDDEINSKKENVPNGATNTCDSVSVGTISKNINKISSITESTNRNSPMQSYSKSKPDVIGPESLVNKLHEKLPLVPVNLISRAVNILRERSGGLTGKDSKQIIAEVKQILKEIAITEKCLRKNKELPPEKPVKTWKKVNNGVHWNNEDPDVNCTICFEFMVPEKRMKLRCQHIFHTTCIKLWLQNDSICPICRSFTTLDEEFPPLK